MSAGRLLVAVALVASTAALVRAAGHPGAARTARLEAFPYVVGAWTGREAEPIDEDSLRILAADSYVNRNYTAVGEPAPVNLYVAYYGRQRPGVSIHSPLHCLPGTGWEPLDVATIEVRLADGGSGRMRRMLVRKNRDRALVLYWYAIHGRMLASEVASKAWLLHDSVRSGRSDAALVRIVVPLGAGVDAAAAERRGVAFARQILPSLHQLWS
jgi:EpsI family protein